MSFSYVYDDSDHNAASFLDHTCFSYDPALARGGRTPYPTEKKDFPTSDGHFVDHCPTEGVVAACDDWEKLQSVRYFYEGKGAADSELVGEDEVRVHPGHVHVVHPGADGPQAAARQGPVRDRVRLSRETAGARG